MARFLFFSYIGVYFLNLAFSFPDEDGDSKSCKAYADRCGENFGGYQACCKGMICQYTNRVERRKRVYICCKRWYHWDGLQMLYAHCPYGRQRDEKGCTLSKCNENFVNLAKGKDRRLQQSHYNREKKHSPKLAIDSNMKTFFSTKAQNRIHWWRINLGEVASIHYVVIHTLDTTGKGALNSKINVEDLEVGEKFLCGYAYAENAMKMGKHLMYKVECETPLTGDYVRVYRRHELSFREIDIYGYFT